MGVLAQRQNAQMLSAGSDVIVVLTMGLPFLGVLAATTLVVF